MSRPRLAERVLFEGHPALLPSFGAWALVIVTFGLALLYFKLRQVGVHYRITTERLVIERGVLSKRLEQVDLHRVTDFVVERPFLQRIAGTGNIVVQAMDKTTPELHLVALPTDVLKLYEELRVAAEAQRHNRGVRIVDYE